MTRQILSVAVRMSATGLIALIASAQVPQKPAGFVTDAASVIPVIEAKRLEGRCAQLDQAHRAQIAIVTVDSLEGEPIQRVALDLFRKWGIGRKGVNDGVLIMLSIRDRQSRITVGYGLEKTISAELAGSILKSMRPDLAGGRYGSALNLALDSLERILPAAKYP